LGGDCDKVVGGDSSSEIAKQILHAKLVVYKGLGHGAYEQDPDFNQQILDFCIKG
jgi:pimeloyl-ACP methyl ester carboxylesterase